MPSLPPDQPTARHPARVILDSPLAAASRASVYRRRNRQRPRERGLRLFAAFGSLLVHLVFLFSFVLGPAYVVKQRPEPKERFVQVRLIEKPEPPPPPPVLGALPKLLGPRHQGSANQLGPVRTHPATAPGRPVAQVAPAAAVRAVPARPELPKPQPIAVPKPPLSVPSPQLQPIPLSDQPPTVTLAVPTLLPPVPPKFQPEPVRKPQLEGNQPMLPPASLALPDVPAQTLPTPEVPIIASKTAVPPVGAPERVAPARAQIPVAAPEPEQPPIPLPAPPAPTVNLQVAPLKVPTPSVPIETPQLQATTVRASEAPPVPKPDVAPAQVELHAPAVKFDVATKLPLPAIQPSVELQPANMPPAAATATPSTAAQTAASPAPATVESPAATANPSGTSSSQVSNARDVSSAPNATPQGSDNATLGEPKGVAAVPATAAGTGTKPTPAQGSGKSTGPGKVGGNQPGAAQGELHGEPGGYVQLKPHGDTQIMNHGTPNIGYQPTRFEQAWTPEGESSLDTALRHAVEKTTVKHTFHLPRGVRVECALRPLLPIALFGCANPDPPPTPLAQKVYDRLDLKPARALAPPAPASVAAPVSALPIKLDNSAECAAARIAGGPLPPGCEGAQAIQPSRPPAAASSSWVPASDQFH